MANRYAFFHAPGPRPIVLSRAATTTCPWGRSRTASRVIVLSTSRHLHRRRRRRSSGAPGDCFICSHLALGCFIVIRPRGGRCKREACKKDTTIIIKQHYSRRYCSVGSRRRQEKTIEVSIRETFFSQINNIYDTRIFFKKCFFFLVLQQKCMVILLCVYHTRFSDVKRWIKLDSLFGGRRNEKKKWNWKTGRYNIILFVLSLLSLCDTIFMK